MPKWNGVIHQPVGLVLKCRGLQPVEILIGQRLGQILPVVRSIQIVFGLNQ
jgi:hypothetical protein